MEMVALVGLFLIYALTATRLGRAWITAPMFFLFSGMLLGPSGVDLIPVSPTTEPVKLLAEVTLALLLFADASTLSLRRAREDRGLPERLLFLGLPLTIAFGCFVAWALFPAIGLAGAALIGAMLAPTDAALGLAVVTDPVVPVRVRRLLNVESGLNDGIATPFVLVFLALAVGEEAGAPGHFVGDALRQMGIAVVVAAVVGFIGGWAFSKTKKSSWSSEQSRDLAVITLALLAYAGSIAVGGNGFVAAFLGGLFFGARRHDEVARPVEFTEGISLFMSYLVWTLFGASIVGPVLRTGTDLVVIIYALLSLTLIRLIPVYLAMLRTGFRRSTIAFVGWFGPRGLASAVFTFIALDSFHEHAATDLELVVTSVAAWTILLSVTAHGLSARPLAGVIGARLAGDPRAPENQVAPEPRVRRQRLDAPAHHAVGAHHGRE